MNHNEIAESFYNTLRDSTKSSYEGMAVIAILIGIMSQQIENPGEPTEHESVLIDKRGYIRIHILTEIITQKEYDEIMKTAKVADFFPSGGKDAKTH